MSAAASHPDAPRRDEADRYAIYACRPPLRRRVYETSRDGIGLGLEMLYEEEEIPRGWRVGVFDRLRRFWLVNPYA